MYVFTCRAILKNIFFIDSDILTAKLPQSFIEDGNLKKYLGTCFFFKYTFPINTLSTSYNYMYSERGSN